MMVRNDREMVYKMAGTNYSTVTKLYSTIILILIYIVRATDAQQAGQRFIKSELYPRFTVNISFPRILGRESQ